MVERKRRGKGVDSRELPGEGKGGLNQELMVNDEKRKI